MNDIYDISPAKAKKILREELNKRGLDNKLSAKTVSFADLARCKRVFVRVHDWKPNPIWQELKLFSAENGFYIET